MSKAGMLRHDPWTSSPSIGQDDGRLVEVIDQLRGDDADDAAMPALARHHQHVVARRRRGRSRPACAPRRRSRLLRPGAACSRRSAARPARAPRRPGASSEASSSRAAMSGEAHAAGGVDARRQHEADVKAVQRLAESGPSRSSSARRPTVCRSFDRRSSPSLAMTRFSPTSGTTSATVPIAAIFRNDGSHFSRPALQAQAWTILSATPTPARCLSG